MRHVIFATLLLVGLAAAQSQPPSSGTEQKSCALLAFDKELRDALSTSDISRIALLVEYPLRINDSRGSWYIHDAASLDGHFSDIFTTTVKKVILRQHLDDENCGAYTVVYGLGEAVANLYERGYRISSINTSTTDAQQKSLLGHVEFACRTDASRMVIDSQADGNQRLRAWDTGKLLTQKPDFEITGGKKEIEGTGGCAHAVWTFQSGESKFSLSEGGCYPDSNQPPSDAHGQFGKKTGAKDESWSWCY